MAIKKPTIQTPQQSALSPQPVSMERRRLLRHTVLGSAGLSLSGLPLSQAMAQPAASGELEAQRVNDKMSLFTGAGTNVLAKRNAEGELIIVDGGLKSHAKDLHKLITETLDTDRVALLMNTHWHPEQTGLNELLSDSTIFAHENTRLWLGVEVQRPWQEHRYDPLPEAAQPDKTFYHYGDMTVGGSDIQYGYMLQAHTDGDMYVFFPEENVLHTGGVISSDAWPLIDWWTGGWIGGLVDGIETLLRVANEDTLIIPATGPVMSYGELSEMRDMYATIYDRIRGLFMQARGPQETLDAKPTAEWDELFGNSDEFVLLAHQSVLPHFAPDA